VSSARILEFASAKRAQERKTMKFKVPSVQQYKDALAKITMTEGQKAMLLFHLEAPNRMAEFAELSAAARKHRGYANVWYGGLGRKIGEEIGVEFDQYVKGAWFSSAIGRSDWQGKTLRLVMHDELAKAIEQTILQKGSLKWGDPQNSDRRVR
jgi:hypothetical protein